MTMGKITTAVFEPGSTTANVYGLRRYDYGRTLRIQGLHLASAVEIHFSLQETGGTFQVLCRTGGCGRKANVIVNKYIGEEKMIIDPEKGAKQIMYVYMTNVFSVDPNTVTETDIKSNPDL